MHLDFNRLCQTKHIATRPRGNWIQLTCPLCGDAGTHGGFYLGWSGSVFTCWRCGRLEFWPTIAAILKTTETLAKKELKPFWEGARSKILRPEVPVVTRKRQAKDLKPPIGNGPLLTQHRKYLEGRNYDPDQLVKDWGISGTNHLGKDWAWRIVIPIKNEAGQIVAYQGRTIGENSAKYKMTDNDKCLEDPDSLLYGIDKTKGDTVLIVEGVTGVWNLGAGTVATFGIKWREEQARRLSRFKRRFILFDPEPEAQDQAGKLATYLSVFPGTTEVLWGFKSDPGEFDPNQAVRIRRNLGLI